MLDPSASEISCTEEPDSEEIDAARVSLDFCPAFDLDMALELPDCLRVESFVLVVFGVAEVDASPPAVCRLGGLKGNRFRFWSISGAIITRIAGCTQVSLAVDPGRGSRHTLFQLANAQHYETKPLYFTNQISNHTSPIPVFCPFTAHPTSYSFDSPKNRYCEQ